MGRFSDSRTAPRVRKMDGMVAVRGRLALAASLLRGTSRMPRLCNTASSWIDSQQERLLALVSDWAATSSHSLDPAGLGRMRARLIEDFAPLGRLAGNAAGRRLVVDATGTEVSEPVGDLLSLRHEAASGPRVLLAIHYDTVYPVDADPRAVSLSDDGRVLRGPGVTDAKGGLAVMLVALEAFMRFGAADRLSWEVLLNGDEELGSPGSADALAAAAARNDLGLLFEPALDEAGTLAGARKGSANLAIVVRGRAAHSGRHFREGRNAVAAAAKLAVAIDRLNHEPAEATFNVAAIDGGVAVNVVPDLAILRLNIRVATAAEADWAIDRVRTLVVAVDDRDGITATLHGGFHCPPKPVDAATARLFDHVTSCGRSLELAITSQPTGGVCDGNKLAAAGLPNIDTLGVRGGSIHSPAEYLLVESLTERAKLTACLLTGLADGSLTWPVRKGDNS